MYAELLEIRRQIARSHSGTPLRALTIATLDTEHLLAPVAALLALRQDALAARDLSTGSEGELEIQALVSYNGDTSLATCMSVATFCRSSVATAGENPNALKVHYPPVFEAPLRSSWEQVGVPVELLYGVMRRESSFDPAARSNADALGLFQFIPTTFDVLGSAAPSPIAGPLAWTFTDVLLWLWGMGAVVVLASALCRIQRFARFAGRAEPAPVFVQRRARALARRLGLRRAPEVRLVPGRLTPMLWAAGRRPVLLLPAELVAAMDPRQQLTLLAHELAHLRRRDHWVRYLELVVRVLHWWNPVVWWACRGLRRAEEECCDAWVVWAMPRASGSYANALLETVEFVSHSRFVMPATASGVGRVDNLRRRLTMIMRGNPRRRSSGPVRIALAALAALALPFSR